MKTIAPLLGLALLVSSCAGIIHKTSVNYLSSYPFKPHNNYVDAYISVSKFPDSTSYIKVAILRQASDNSHLDRQISVLKKKAQNIGADAIILLGLNDSGIKVAQEYGFGKEVINALRQEGRIDFYTKTMENVMTVMAIKYKRNLPKMDGTLKSVDMFVYDNSKRDYDLKDTYKFNFKKEVIGGDTKNAHFKSLYSYYSSVIADMNPSMWVVLSKNDSTITKRYIGKDCPDVTFRYTYSPDGRIIEAENIPVSRLESMLGGKKTSIERIEYIYDNAKKLTACVYKTKEATYMEEYTFDGLNNVDRVTVYKKNGEEMVPVMKLQCNYYSNNDFSQLLTENE